MYFVFCIRILKLITPSLLILMKYTLNQMKHRNWQKLL
nr:MAG TPA: hypothetical protein [Caudoviricetes sp.]DAI58388.1 MAG TPA: hypothetical protein [Crassvirales sp.]